jgi:hypothetical protein
MVKRFLALSSNPSTAEKQKERDREEERKEGRKELQHCHHM